MDDEGNDKPKETQKKGDEIDMSRWEGSENYQAVDDACKELLESKGKSEVLAYLKRIQEEGALDQSSYMLLYSKYRG